MKQTRTHKIVFAAVFASIFVALIATIIVAASPAFSSSNDSTAYASSETKRAVPFSEVEVNDGFMRDYMKLVICEVIPTAIINVEKQDGGIPNIQACGDWHKAGSKPEAKPEHHGALYVDSDVHKVLESMCMALDTPSGGDPEIEAAQNSIKARLVK